MNGGGRRKGPQTAFADTDDWSHRGDLDIYNHGHSLAIDSGVGKRGCRRLERRWALRRRDEVVANVTVSASVDVIHCVRASCGPADSFLLSSSISTCDCFVCTSAV